MLTLSKKQHRLRWPGLLNAAGRAKFLFFPFARRLDGF